MEESFLHFVWKFQKFNSIDLRTKDGNPVSIFDVGQHNHDAGPDFHNARVKIDNLEWNGHVEIHIRSSDWRHHKHGNDQAYDNVVLHVVWENDENTFRKDGTVIPTVELKNRVNPNLLENHLKFISGHQDIACQEQLHTIPRLTWINQLDRMLALRLEQKAERIIAIAEETNNNWEEVAYRVLARSFGFSLNSDAFERMSESLPLKLIAKHADQPLQVEALLLGQSGFLENPLDEYGEKLKSEFDFLQKKYQLNFTLHRTHWKFGKTRPSNFPTVRIAQLAAILTKNPALFSTIRQARSSADIKEMLNSQVSKYWQSHFDFGKALKKGHNQLGNASLEVLVINAVAPTIAAFALQTDQPELMERATTFLEQIPAESNRYTLKWKAAGKAPKSAFDSQAMITLYKDYCVRKKCLQCAVGTTLFNK